MPYPTKKLGDCLIQFDRGISWSRKDEGGTIAVLRIPNIQEGQINLDDLKYISAKNGNGELDKNDIVMVASNGNPDLVGRSALVTEREERMKFASFLIRLRFDNTKLLSQYAHLFLLTPTFKRELRRKIATTSGIYNLKKEHIEKIKIPLPPLAIQKQIVERLDKIAEAQKLNDDLIQKTDELFQSLLHQELKPTGKDWEEKTMVDIAEARSGFGFPLDLQGDKNEGLPFYKVSDMNLAGNKIEMKSHNNSISVAKSEKLKYKPAPAGSVIFPKIGAAVATNKKRILVRDSLYDNNVMALIPNKLVSPSFLYFWLIKFDISQWASQSMPPSIKKTTVEKYKTLIPPLEIQKQIVAKLSAVQDYKTQLLAQKSKLKELFYSALAKSFKSL